MTERLIFPEWRDENAKAKYTFADSATLDNGEYQIDEAAFLDGRLYPIGGNERLYLSRITRDGDDITLGISAEGLGELATATFSVASPPDNGELAFSDAYGRPAGILLSTPTALAALGALDQGTQAMMLAQTRFAATVVIPQPDVGVRGILTEEGDFLAGDVWLVGEDGVVLREEDGAIRVDFIGEPYASRELCQDEEPQEGGETVEPILAPFCPIKTINGYAPNDYGNLELRIGSDQSETNIMRIIGQNGQLKISLLGQRKFRGV